MKNSDSSGHVTGKSVFLDDIPVISGTLFATVVASQCAHGFIKSVDFQYASGFPGIFRILTWKDIPGENQIGGIIPDEPLMAEKEVHFIGQPVALILAESELAARKARNLIKIDYEELPPVIDPRDAKDSGQLLFPPRTFKTGDTSSVWEKCAYVFEGRADTGAQEHVYLETQGAYSYLTEAGNLMVHSATQGPTVVQKTIARVLGIPMHRIEVDVRRLGGAFGGKEDQASAWAALAGLGAYITGRPVKLVLSRHDDLYMTGKRHPYSADFKIGLSEDYKILSWEVSYYQNGGAAADLSPAIMERTLFHSTNSYFIPNVKATAYSCKTNLTPFTAFRGFGAPQAMFVLESAISLAAERLNIPALTIQQRNLIGEDDTFPYGQKVVNANAKACWNEVCNGYELESKIQRIHLFNQTDTFFKKGLSLMPVCFGISFTKTPLNQARALVHIYQDGSIGISTGAVEMGQGVNTRLKHVAAHEFSVGAERVKLETTNTTRVANTSPTAASSGADLNGNALLLACSELMLRLKGTASRMTGCNSDLIRIKNEQVIADGIETGIFWNKLIETAYLERTNLSQSSHYATPEIFFDKTIERGHPFAYYVFGTAITEVTLDCLRGQYIVDSVQIVHDTGSGINRELDLAQVEGGLLQGIGWMTMEEIRYNEKGKLLSDSLSTYKVPDIYSAPRAVSCKFLDTEGPNLAVLGSKAIGEPPFMYGIGTYFALRNAIKAFNPNLELKFDAPLTPEKVLSALYLQ
jgi:xanthine dehydrogenase large subunit